MEPVSILVVVSAAVVGFIYAGVWFRPSVLGTTWQSLLPSKKEDRQKGSRKALVLTLVIYTLMSFAMAEYIHALHTQGAAGGALQGLYLGIAFAASNGLVSNLFRVEPLKLFLVEYGQVVSTMGIMGAILGQWA